MPLKLDDNNKAEMSTENVARWSRNKDQVIGKQNISGI